VSRAIGGGEPIGDVFESDILILPSTLRHGQDLGLYEEHKRGNNLMDYDDLLVNLIRLRGARACQERRFHPMATHPCGRVSGYEQASGRIVRLLAYVHDNVMVEDDSRAFTRSGGADFTNIMEFPKAFKNTRVIRLEENYRSTAPS
jgi:DNA helicase-2/ATP-dependent DNA helicase PcrA